jgi:hypothetical protein
MDIFSRDVYTKRFPELESLVVQPLEYLMTAKELGNQIENVKNNETLQQFLTQVFYLLLYYIIFHCSFIGLRLVPSSCCLNCITNFRAI